MGVKDLHVIITMAGAGSRFRKQGILTHKHEIKVKGRTLLEWSLLSLRDFFSENFIFVVRIGHYTDNFINRVCNEMGIKEYKIIVLSEISKGQAATALSCDSFVSNDSPVIIYNIDTYITPGVINPNIGKDDNSGYIPIYETNNMGLSYVRLGRENTITEIREKNKISNYGSIGFYFFKSWWLYREAYQYTYSNDNMGEHYIAPMYNALLEWNMTVGYQIIDKNNVHILGTPYDVQLFDLKNDIIE